MVESIDVALIRPGPPPSSDLLAEQEMEAFEPKADAATVQDDYATADTQHKIGLLKIQASAEALKLDRQRIDLEREKAHVESLRQDIDARKEYSNKIFTLVSFWLMGILGVVVMSAFVGRMSDKVILALIGGTTINVLGLFLVVANYLFPKNGKSPARSTADGDKK